MLHNVVLVSNVSRDIGLCTQELGHFGAIHCHCIKRFMQLPPLPRPRTATAFTLFNYIAIYDSDKTRRKQPQ